MVELEEVASSYLACEASALLLSYSPKKMVDTVGYRALVLIILQG